MQQGNKARQGKAKQGDMVRCHYSVIASRCQTDAAPIFYPINFELTLHIATPHQQRDTDWLQSS